MLSHFKMEHLKSFVFTFFFHLHFSVSLISTINMYTLKINAHSLGWPLCKRKTRQEPINIGKLEKLKSFCSCNGEKFGIIVPQKIKNRASLVAQWLRICLLMQGTRVRALVWEDPTCHGAAGPVSHNY